MTRRYDAATRNWSDPIQRLTESAGADVNVVATRARSGAVWLAWQAWRGQDFDIHVATLDENGLTNKGQIGAKTKNDWSPAITSDRKGNVYVAYDSYQNGNFDVQLATFDESRRSTGPVPSRLIAHSPRFEVRPSLVCDAQDRLWIAWEDGSWARRRCRSTSFRDPRQTGADRGLMERLLDSTTLAVVVVEAPSPPNCSRQRMSEIRRLPREQFGGEGWGEGTAC